MEIGIFGGMRKNISRRFDGGQRIIIEPEN